MDLKTLTPSRKVADELFPPTHIGPVWQADENGDWLLPEKTIGPQVAAWAETWLGAIDGEGSLVLTNEQLRLIMWMYAVDDEGKFAYRKTVYQAFKGAGKDPFAAVIAMIEFVGPSQFSHWAEDGHPVGKPHPRAWVHLLAVSKEQNVNTMSVFPALITKELIAQHGLDVQKEIIYAPGGRRLQMMGSSPRSIEGRRPTFSVFNETQHWLSQNSGHNLYETESRNLTKTGGRSLMITNAYRPGEDSLAERIRNEQEKVWAGVKKPSGWLYHSIEAHPKAPLAPEWLPFIMDSIIGDAFWWRSKMTALVQDVMDAASMSADGARRMFYNQIVVSASAFFAPDEINGALKEGCYGDTRDLKIGDEIVLGFDGSKTQDATALVAIRLEDKLIVPLHVQQRPESVDDWYVDEELVDEAVMSAFATYRVKAFFADVHLWESYVSKWSETYGEQLEVAASGRNRVGYDMRGSKELMSRNWEAFRQAIRDARLKHNNDGVWRIHALNAQTRHNGVGIIAGKEKHDSPRKIDCMVASYVAYSALLAWIEKGKKQPQYSRRVVRSTPRAGY